GLDLGLGFLPKAPLMCSDEKALELARKPLELLADREVLRADKLDEPSLGDALGHRATALDRDVVTLAVQEQGRNANRREDSAHVDLRVHAAQRPDHRRAAALPVVIH